MNFKKSLIAAGVVLSMMPASVFAVEVSSGKVPAKDGDEIMFKTIMTVGAADIVQDGILTVSTDQGEFVKDSVKVSVDGTSVKAEDLSVREENFSLNLSKADAAKLTDGKQLIFTGKVKIKDDTQKEAKFNIDANSIGLGKHETAYASITDENDVVSVIGLVKDISYDDKQLISDLQLTFPDGEDTLDLTLPGDFEWNIVTNKPANLNGMTVKAVKGSKLTLKKGATKNGILKGIIDVGKDAPAGEVEISVTGKTAEKFVTVANLKAYAPKLEVKGGAKDMLTSEKSVKANVVLTSEGGALPKDSYVDFTVNGGKVKGAVKDAKETGDKAKIKDFTDEFSFRTNDAGQKMTLDLEVVPDLSASEVTLTAKLSNGEVKETLVKLSEPVSVSHQVSSINGGTVNEKVDGIVLTENQSRSLNSGEIYGIVPERKFNNIDFVFDKNWTLKAENIKVEKLDTAKAGRALLFTVKSRSTGGSIGKITIDDLMVTSPADIADGEYKAVLFRAVSPAKNLDSVFTEDGKEYGIYRIKDFDFVKVGKTAPTEVKNDVVFTLGSALYMDGATSKKLTSAVYTKNGYTMLPVRAVAEAVGIDVEWNQATNIATFKDADKNITVTVGLNVDYLTKNGEKVKMNVASELKNDSIFLPLSSVAEAFGIKRGTGYEWISQTKQVVVHK